MTRYRVITETPTYETVEFDCLDFPAADVNPVLVVCDSGTIIPWARILRLVPIR